MPYKCSVPGCRSNYANASDNISVFLYPRNETLRQEWIKVMPKDFVVYKTSRVCELHFEPSVVLREASAYDPRTGRTLTAPLRIPHLKQGAVPTLLLPPPGGIVPSRKKLKVKKKPREDHTLKEGTEKTNQSEPEKSLQTDFGTELTNAAETSVVIKQEMDDSSISPPPPVIVKFLCMEELLPSSSNSSSTIIIPPVPENTLSIANPDSTTVDQTLETTISNQPVQNRKINDAELKSNTTIKQKTAESTVDPAQLMIRTVPSPTELPSSSNTSSFSSIILPVPKDMGPIADPDSTNKHQTSETRVSKKPSDKKRKITDATDSTPDAIKAKSKRHPKRSRSSKRRRKRKLRSSSGPSKKSVSPTENGKDATPETFRSLLDDADNIPQFGSETAERPEDLFDLFSDFVADKLREMDWDNCAYALRSILDIVFKASQGHPDCKLKSDVSSPNTSSRSSDQE